MEYEFAFIIVKHLKALDVHIVFSKDVDIITINIEERGLDMRIKIIEILQ
ncbi:hypothetical protein Syun_000728 [Stephania yunnanensis]|uniref:Uncharacterized protein n=1 Tax=Stephania yunnanensis TaxID=152371 RepID=A0AAP0LDM9_9MAGN